MPLNPYGIGVKDIMSFSGMSFSGQKKDTSRRIPQEGYLKKDTSRMNVIRILFMKPSLPFEYG